MFKRNEKINGLLFVTEQVCLTSIILTNEVIWYPSKLYTILQTVVSKNVSGTTVVSSAHHPSFP